MARKFDNPNANLIELFDEMMNELRPSVFRDLNYEFKETHKLNHISVFVINWMVHESDWKLLNRCVRREWRDEVVKKWFDAGNTESAEVFLQRAENYLMDFRLLCIVWILDSVRNKWNNLEQSAPVMQYDFRNGMLEIISGFITAHPKQTT